MKIIWAYNPFLENKETNITGSEILKKYFPEDSIHVNYISSNSESELAYAFDIPPKYRYSMYPKKIVMKQIESLNLKKIKVEVLPSMTLSLTDAVETLVKHAKEVKADLILVSTNGKKSSLFQILGSFAESLIHSSSTDLLMYHQKTKLLTEKPKKILYAFDHTPKGISGLSKAISYAKKWDATLHIIHIPSPAGEESDEEYEQNVEGRTKKTEKFLAPAKISYKFANLFDDAPIEKVILDYAKKQKIDIISMAAKSNKLQVLLGGSVTRKVLRDATIPVLILKI